MPGMLGSPSLLNGWSRHQRCCAPTKDARGDLTDDQAQANEPLKESEFRAEGGPLEEDELVLGENDTLEDEASEAPERGGNVDRQ